MSTTTTTTTEISSNPNSSCRLLVCLNTLPFHDQRAFRSQLDHIELLRLSACCRSLRSSIRNDRALWQALYHRDFLSGTYYAEEMDFVLWCVRTDVNNPCTSDKRADLLENVDWYNTYRRRVSTENNWRFGRCKTTYINMEPDKNGSCYSVGTEYNSLVTIHQDRSDETPGHNYILEYLPHSNLRSSNNTVYNTVRPDIFESDTHYTVKILTRKHGGVFTTFNIPIPYEMMTVEGKWILLVYEREDLFHDSPVCIIGIMVFDIDNSIMCPGSIDDTWHAIRFYKTTNDTAVVYTARLVKDDYTDRIEWALYQFSSNNPVVQLRNGSFELPEGVMATSMHLARNPCNSHMIIGLFGHSDYYPCIIHSVTSSDQSHTPRHCYTTSRQHMPIPLLRIGCRYLMFNFKPRKVWTDLSYSDDQVLRIPDVIFGINIIGDIYVFIARDHNRRGSRLLVDINTKEIIRKLEAPNMSWESDKHTIVGTLYNPVDSDVSIVQEYGEL